jgi:hypothetical protein
LKRSGRGASAGSTRRGDALGGRAFGGSIGTLCTEPVESGIGWGAPGGHALGGGGDLLGGGAPEGSALSGRAFGGAIGNLCTQPVESGIGWGAPGGRALGGGAPGSCASPAPGTFVDDPSSNGSHRFCDAAVTSLFTFASWLGLSRTAAGAASAKLMMKNIRRVCVSILCCRIFMGFVT